MVAKRTNKQYPTEFKEEAVALIHQQGYSVSEATKSLGIGTSLLYKWKEKVEAQRDSNAIKEDERSELKRLRAENKTLRMEKEIHKPVLRERNEVKFEFIRFESDNFPTRELCRVLQVSTSAYYAWDKRPGKLISADTLHLYRRVKELFKQSRGI
jgi:transposase-like protein